MDITLKELLIKISNLVQKRKIINHRNIRALNTKEWIEAIYGANYPEDALDWGYIGSDTLRDILLKIVENPERLLDGYISDLGHALFDLEMSYLGDKIENYQDNRPNPEENSIKNLDKLIRAAEKFVRITYSRKDGN